MLVIIIFMKVTLKQRVEYFGIVFLGGDKGSKAGAKGGGE